MISIFPPVGPPSLYYVQGPPHPRVRPSNFSLTWTVHAPLRDNVHRIGPRSIDFKEHKYSLGMPSVPSVPSYLSLLNSQPLL